MSVAGLSRQLAELKFGGTELTRREVQVLKLQAYGFTGPEVARRLGISKESVKTYNARVKSRLGARTAAHAVAIAMSREII